MRFDIVQTLTDDQKIQARANIDAAKSNHTHNYAGSNSVGGAATSADKVNSNLVVKLNSGATEGTNLFTFNGSAAKTINITPSAIGAAPSSHGTHVTADTVKSALGIGSGTSKYLREDGTWQIPPDTHYTNFLQIKGNGIEAIKFTQSADKILNLKPGANVSIAAASGEITISATNTDTKVTSVDNHYLPTADSGSELTATINGAAGTYAKDTEYTVLTGIKVQRDAKGHITGITYTAQKIKDTNTTYTIPTKSSWDYDDRYVKYTEEQELNSTQKEQARSNIGAGTSNLTLAGNGSATTAAKSDHTHNYAGSSSAGGAATSANKVNAALTFNNSGNGAVSDTTFDGSTAKTISYNTIGAAASSHNHDDRYYTETEIDTKLSGKSDTNHNHDDKYLGKTAKATDSDKLDGKDSTYYLDYKNLKNTPSNATTSIPGLMSSEDKEHLDTLAALLEGKDSTIDTITEVLKAFENAPEGTNIANALAGKVDKVDGKGLSTNDFTTAEKEKLAGIESGANAYVLPAASASLGGVKTGGDVTITDGVISVNDDSHNHIISNIDGLQSALDGKANSSHTHSQYLTSVKSLNTNNTSAQTVNGNEAITGSGTINLHKVAKTGSYNDLSNKPTIPTVNNGTLTIQKNGTVVATFGANQSTNATANITVPVKVSELTNDSGFTTNKGTITGINMNGASKGTSGVVDLGTVLTDASKFATSAQGTKADNAMPKSGGTFTGEVKFGSTENFQGYYIKRMLGSLGIGTAYNNLDSSYKDGTYHRMWRLRFPSGSSFWGKIKVTLYGDYSSFNASGLMSKSITCNFNTSNIYNNVGCYDGLGVNVERDFRISEAIWNATASAWEILIWQQHLNGNNPATIMLECWTKNNTNYIKAFNGIAAQTVELTQSTSYSAQKASPTGGTKTVTWATLPVYENPLGEEIATVAMLEDKQDKITSSNKLSASLVSDLAKVATSGSYNDLLNKPTKLSDFTDDKVIKFTNTTVAASAFVADNNYSNYGYCASISLSGVTANDTADIYFSGKQVEQEIYASFCESYAGGVKIYAAEKPSEAVIIPLILIHK